LLKAMRRNARLALSALAKCKNADFVRLP
jgi:hypothetical protein